MAKRFIDAERIDFSPLIDDFDRARAKVIIMGQPTADVMEVKHGYNATDMHPVDEFVCSVCGFICQDYTEMVYDEDGEDTYYRECEFKYCPNCGAKMKER